MHPTTERAMDEASQDTGHLDEQLTALLEQIETTVTNVVERVSDDSPGLSYSDLEARFNPPVPKQDTESPPQDHDAPESADPERQLDDAVEAMLQDAVDESGIRATPEQAQALDDELARMGDELLARDPDLDADLAIDADDSPLDDPLDETPDLNLDPQSEPDIITDLHFDVDRDATPPARSRVALLDLDTSVNQELGERTSAIPAPPLPASLHRPDPSRAPARAMLDKAITAARTLSAVTKRNAPIVWSRAKPAAMTGLTLLSRPLDRAAPGVRSAIGYFAFVTAFWAALVLFYALVIQDAPDPEPTQPAVELSESPG
jgi:hypothetical protein